MKLSANIQRDIHQYARAHNVRSHEGPEPLPIPGEPAAKANAAAPLPIPGHPATNASLHTNPNREPARPQTTRGAGVEPLEVPR